MELKQVRDVFAVVDKVSSLTGRMKDKAGSELVHEVVESLYALVGPVSANLAAGVLELGRTEVGKLVDHGVPVKDGTDPRQLHVVLAVAQDLRAQRDHLNAIRWWLEDRALLADEGVDGGITEPGDDVVTPHARQQVNGLDRSNREKFDAWLSKLDKQGVPATDHRVTGTSHRVRVKHLDPLRVVVLELPKDKRAVVLLVEPRTDTYGYVHLLGKTKPGRRTAPFFRREDRLPDWNPTLEALAERAGELVEGR